MKTLNDHVILYDSECPLCLAYTKGFVAAGMLPQNGRAPYQQLTPEICPLIDRKRAVNEIALVNTKTGEVTYGIFSLFKIIGNAFPIFGPLFHFTPFIWLMKKFYAFISYNRKVIIPAAAHGESILPDFKLTYRTAWLVFTWLVTAFILSRYNKLMIGVVPAGNTYREYFICGGQIIFQGLIISTYNRKKLWDYLGNMMTISLAGALLLLPVYLMRNRLGLAPEGYALIFMAVTGLMFIEHIRRSRLLKTGMTQTFTWVLYRLILLLIIR